jgi:hypothetical protein
MAKNKNKNETQKVTHCSQRVVRDTISGGERKVVKGRAPQKNSYPEKSKLKRPSINVHKMAKNKNKNETQR